MTSPNKKRPIPNPFGTPARSGTLPNRLAGIAHLLGISSPPPPVTETDKFKRIGDAQELNDVIPGMGSEYWHSTWSSPKAFSDWIKSQDPKKAWQDSGRDDSELKWSGGVTLKQTFELADAGWPEGAKRIDRVRTRIAAKNPVGPKFIKYGIAGAYPNVPRAISGNPLNMRTIDLSRSRRRPVLTLISNMSANSSVNADMITNRGAVCAAIIDMIEQQGFACEVIASSYSSGRGKFMASTSVLIKSSSQAVDTGRLAFGIGHAAMFRRLIFCDRAYDKFNENRLGYGLGCATEMPLDGLKERGIFVLPSAGEAPSLFETEEIAENAGLDFLIKSLSEQGCPAFAGHSTSETSNANTNNQ